MFSQVESDIFHSSIGIYTATDNFHDRHIIYYNRYVAPVVYNMTIVRIYKMNIPNDPKVYIGSTTQSDLKKRLAGHRSNGGTSADAYFSDEGWDDVIMTELETCACENRLIREQYWMDKQNPDDLINTKRACAKPKKRERSRD